MTDGEVHELQGLFLSRARLRADASVQALAPLLLPASEPGRFEAAHRLVWSLMTDGADRVRDFLWREEKPGKFMILSRRPPVSNADLFDIESKPFAPSLCGGDRLHFVLRANPTVSHHADAAAEGATRTRGKRHDVVMHALHHLPQSERKAARPLIVQQRVAAWLRERGGRAGFTLHDGYFVADGYRQLRLGRAGARPMVVGCVECEGELTVADPPLFLTALAQGFGRARAYGCGLMLIRRA